MHTILSLHHGSFYQGSRFVASDDNNQATFMLSYLTSLTFAPSLSVLIL